MGWEGSVKSGVGDPRENESWIVVMERVLLECAFVEGRQKEVGVNIAKLF